MGLRCRLAFLACTVFCVVGVRAAGPEPLPTSQELHKLFDDKQYQPVVQKLVRVLQLKGEAAQQYDRVDMLMLRGESLLQLKQQAPAIEAFDEAVKEATDPKQTVTRRPEQVARVRALDLLVHRSHLAAYTPKHPEAGQRPTPISLLDMSQRDAAFKALLADEEADLAPKAKAAARGMTLGPIIQMIRGLGDLRSVELVVTKQTKDSDAILAEMADRAHTLMSTEVDRLTPAEDRISRVAHQKTRHINYQRDNNGNVTVVSTTVSMNGLNPNDQSNLKQIVSTAEQISSASAQFRDIATGELAAKFSTLGAKADKLAGDASATLSDDYRTVTTMANGTLGR